MYVPPRAWGVARHLMVGTPTMQSQIVAKLCWVTAACPGHVLALAGSAWAEPVKFGERFA